MPAARPGRGTKSAAMRGVVPNASGELVYVVERDEIVRDSLKALIESYGYAVRSFADNEGFLAGSEPGGSACLVLGFNRYNVDADKCLRGLKAVRPDLPVILVVGQGSKFPAAAALAGAVAQLERPVDEVTLIQAIKRAASSRTSQPRHEDTVP